MFGQSLKVRVFGENTYVMNMDLTKALGVSTPDITRLLKVTPDVDYSHDKQFEAKFPIARARKYTTLEVAHKIAEARKHTTRTIGDNTFPVYSIDGEIYVVGIDINHTKPSEDYVTDPQIKERVRILRNFQKKTRRGATSLDRILKLDYVETYLKGRRRTKKRKRVSISQMDLVEFEGKRAKVVCEKGPKSFVIMFEEPIEGQSRIQEIEASKLKKI